MLMPPKQTEIPDGFHFEVFYKNPEDNRLEEFEDCLHHIEKITNTKLKINHLRTNWGTYMKRFSFEKSNGLDCLDEFNQLIINGMNRKIESKK
jgi:hypothetical protein